MVQTGPAIQPHEPKAGSRAGSQTPAVNKPPTPTAVKTESPSRATSPVPPGHGGHSVVAMRATSPKAPKLKATNGSNHAASPLAGGGSRATSPVGTGASGRGESPPVPGADGVKTGNKRKATEEPMSPTATSSAGGAPSKAKKRKATVSGGEITQQMLVEWLVNTPNATTKDCIQYFSSYLPKEDKQKKQGFADLVKEVATLKDGVLVLRNAYRTGNPG